MSANQPEKTIENILRDYDDDNACICYRDCAHPKDISGAQAALSAMVDTLIKEAKPAEYQAHSWQSGLEKKAFDDAIRVYEYKLRELAAKMGLIIKEDK